MGTKKGPSWGVDRCGGSTVSFFFLSVINGNTVMVEQVRSASAH